MTLTDLIVIEPNPDTEQDPLDLLLNNRAQVQAEFAAIMNASGFGDRIIVGTIRHPPHRDRILRTRNALLGDSEIIRFRTRTSSSRVRSPPGSD